MSCIFTYKGIKYNSLEELKRLAPKLQREKLYDSLVKKRSNPEFINKIKTAVEASEFKSKPNVILPKNTKEGVSELFDSNPELANAIYEAAGFIQESSTEAKEAEIERKRQEELNSSDLYHTGDDLTLENVSVEPRVTRQGRKGKYGGLYTYDNLEDIKTFSQGNNTKNTFGITLNKGVEIKEYTGSIERLNKEKLEELRQQGYQVVKGKSLFGRTEIIIIDKSAIKSVESHNEINAKYDAELATLKGNTQITPQQKQQALQLYSQYLDTVFPDSKVKDIVYHGTNKKFDSFNFDNLATGNMAMSHKRTSNEIYFSDNVKVAEVFSLNLDVESPIIISAIINAVNGQYRQYSENVGITANYYVLKNPSDAHILGSQKDIEGFKKFVNKENKTIDNFDEYVNYSAKIELGILPNPENGLFNDLENNIKYEHKHNTINNINAYNKYLKHGVDSFTLGETEKERFSAPNEKILSSIPEDEAAWFNDVLPLVTIDIEKGLIDGISHGQVVDSLKIMVSNEASVGTLYHEAFHIISNVFLGKGVYKKLLEDTVNRLKDTVVPISSETGVIFMKVSEMTNDQLNEYLAEEFSKFMRFGEDYSFPPKASRQKNWFYKILDLILNFFGIKVGKDNASMEEAFEYIKSGKFVSDVKVDLNKYNRVSDLNDIERNNFIIRLNSEFSNWIFTNTSETKDITSDQSISKKIHDINNKSLLDVKDFYDYLLDPIDGSETSETRDFKKFFNAYVIKYIGEFSASFSNIEEIKRNILKDIFDHHAEYLTNRGLSISINSIFDENSDENPETSLSDSDAKNNTDLDFVGSTEEEFETRGFGNNKISVSQLKKIPKGIKLLFSGLYIENENSNYLKEITFDEMFLTIQRLMNGKKLEDFSNTLENLINNSSTKYAKVYHTLLTRYNNIEEETFFISDNGVKTLFPNALENFNFLSNIYKEISKSILHFLELKNARLENPIAKQQLNKYINLGLLGIKTSDIWQTSKSKSGINLEKTIRASNNTPIQFIQKLNLPFRVISEYDNIPGEYKSLVINAITNIKKALTDEKILQTIPSVFNNKILTEYDLLQSGGKIVKTFYGEGLRVLAELEYELFGNNKELIVRSVTDNSKKHSFGLNTYLTKLLNDITFAINEDIQQNNANNRFYKVLRTYDYLTDDSTPDNMQLNNIVKDNFILKNLLTRYFDVIEKDDTTVKITVKESIHNGDKNSNLDIKDYTTQSFLGQDLIAILKEDMIPFPIFGTRDRLSNINIYDNVSSVYGFGSTIDNLVLENKSVKDFLKEEQLKLIKSDFFRMLESKANPANSVIQENANTWIFAEMYFAKLKSEVLDKIGDFNLDLNELSLEYVELLENAISKDSSGKIITDSLFDIPTKVYDLYKQGLYEKAWLEFFNDSRKTQFDSNFEFVMYRGAIRMYSSKLKSIQNEHTENNQLFFKSEELDKNGKASYFNVLTSLGKLSSIVSQNTILVDENTGSKFIDNNSELGNLISEELLDILGVANLLLTVNYQTSMQFSLGSPAYLSTIKNFQRRLELISSPREVTNSSDTFEIESFGSGAKSNSIRVNVLKDKYLDMTDDLGFKNLIADFEDLIESIEDEKLKASYIKSKNEIISSHNKKNSTEVTDALTLVSLDFYRALLLKHGLWKEGSGLEVRYQFQNQSLMHKLIQINKTRKNKDKLKLKVNEEMVVIDETIFEKHPMLKHHTDGKYNFDEKLNIFVPTFNKDGVVSEIDIISGNHSEKFKIIKPSGFSKQKIKGSSAIVLLKTAFSPKIPTEIIAMAEEQQSDEMIIDLLNELNEGLDAEVYQSATKNTLPLGMLDISSTNIGMQVTDSFKDNKQSQFSKQLLAVFNLDVVENPLFSTMDKKEEALRYKNFNDSMSLINETNAFLFYASIGAVLNFKENKITVINKAKFKSSLADLLNSDQHTIQERELLNTVIKSGQSYDATGFSEILNNATLSKILKNIIDTRDPSIKTYVQESGITYNQNLKYWRKDASGKILPPQVKIPIPKAYVPWIIKTFGDSNLSNSKNTIYAFNQFKKAFANKNHPLIPEEMRKSIINRTPLDGRHSATPVEIVEYLMPWDGSKIVISPMLVLIYGFDFDFDKLTTYTFTPKTLETNKKPIYVKLNPNEKIKLKLDLVFEDYVNGKNHKNTKELLSLIGFGNPSPLKTLANRLRKLDREEKELVKRFSKDSKNLESNIEDLTNKLNFDEQRLKDQGVPDATIRMHKRYAEKNAEKNKKALENKVIEFNTPYIERLEKVIKDFRKSNEKEYKEIIRQIIEDLKSDNRFNEEISVVETLFNNTSDILNNILELMYSSQMQPANIFGSLIPTTTKNITNESSKYIDYNKVSTYGTFSSLFDPLHNAEAAGILLSAEKAVGIVAAIESFYFRMQSSPIKVNSEFKHPFLGVNQVNMVLGKSYDFNGTPTSLHLQETINTVLDAVKQLDPFYAGVSDFTLSLIVSLLITSSDTDFTGRNTGNMDIKSILQLLNIPIVKSFLKKTSSYNITSSKKESMGNAIFDVLSEMVYGESNHHMKIDKILKDKKFYFTYKSISSYFSALAFGSKAWQNEAKSNMEKNLSQMTSFFKDNLKENYDFSKFHEMSENNVTDIKSMAMLLDSLATLFIYSDQFTKLSISFRKDSGLPKDELILYKQHEDRRTILVGDGFYEPSSVNAFLNSTFLKPFILQNDIALNNIQENNVLFNVLGKIKYDDLLKLLPSSVDKQLLSASLIAYLSQTISLPNEMPSEFKGQNYIDVLIQLLDYNSPNNLLIRFEKLKKLVPNNLLVNFIIVSNTFGNRLNKNEEQLINISLLSEDSNATISDFNNDYNSLMNNNNEEIRLAARSFFDAAALASLSTNGQKINKGLQKINMNNPVGLNYKLALLDAFSKTPLDESFVDDFAKAIVANNAFYLSKIPKYTFSDKKLIELYSNENEIPYNLYYEGFKYMPPFISIPYSLQIPNKSITIGKKNDKYAKYTSKIINFIYQTERNNQQENQGYNLTLVPFKGANEFGILFETDQLNLIKSNNMNYYNALYARNNQEYQNDRLSEANPVNEIISLNPELYSEIQGLITNSIQNQIKVIDSAELSKLVKINKVYKIENSENHNLYVLVKILDVFGNDLVSFQDIVTTEFASGSSSKSYNTYSNPDYEQIEKLSDLLSEYDLSQAIIHAINREDTDLFNAIKDLKLLFSAKQFESLPKNGAIIVTALTEKNVIFLNLYEQIKNLSIYNPSKSVNLNIENVLNLLLAGKEIDPLFNETRFKQAIITEIVNKFSKNFKFGREFSEKLFDFYTKDGESISVLKSNSVELSKVAEELLEQNIELPENTTIENLSKLHDNVDDIIDAYKKIDFLIPENDFEEDYSNYSKNDKLSLAIDIANGVVKVTCKI